MRIVRLSIEDDESDSEEEGAESEHEGSEGWIARSIFGSIHDCSLTRPTSDTAYSILADALPLGPHRCRKQRRRGICDLCYLLRGETVIETTRHLALECPYTGLVHEAVLRTVLEVTTLDDAVREETRRSRWQRLAHVVIVGSSSGNCAPVLSKHLFGGNEPWRPPLHDAFARFADAFES